MDAHGTIVKLWNLALKSTTSAKAIVHGICRLFPSILAHPVPLTTRVALAKIRRDGNPALIIIATVLLAARIKRWNSVCFHARLALRITRLVLLTTRMTGRTALKPTTAASVSALGLQKRMSPLHHVSIAPKTIPLATTTAPVTGRFASKIITCALMAAHWLFTIKSLLSDLMFTFLFLWPLESKV